MIQYRGGMAPQSHLFLQMLTQSRPTSYQGLQLIYASIAHDDAQQMCKPQRGELTLSVVQADPGTKEQSQEPCTDAKLSAVGEAELVKSETDAEG